MLASEDIGVLVQAFVAVVLGGVLGWEREAAGKWAGLRTHMLVCLSAMLFVRIGQFLIEDAQASLAADTLRTDPVRIIEAIVTGLAFLGGGIIFRDPDRNVARGATTAASLMTVATIGIAIAIGRYGLALGITLLVLFIMRVVRILAIRIEGRPHRDTLDD